MPADVQLVQSVSAGFLIILLFVNHRVYPTSGPIVIVLGMANMETR